MARKPRRLETNWLDGEVDTPRGRGSAALEGSPVRLSAPHYLTYKQAKRIHRWLGEAIAYLEARRDFR